jgi:hypothetical protein
MWSARRPPPHTRMWSVEVMSGIGHSEHNALCSPPSQLNGMYIVVVRRGASYKAVVAGSSCISASKSCHTEDLLIMYNRVS